VLIVVVIIGILAAVGYPSYLQYVTRAKRTTAKSVLTQVADRQEQYFADNKQYADTMTQLGYSANPFAINDDGAQVPAANTSRIYLVQLANTGGTTTFTAQAVPQLSQATRDAKCATLTLTHQGLRGQTGTSTDCW
jgi:type IV pilus assembly protein PilE